MKNIIIFVLSAIFLSSGLSYGKKAPDVYFESLDGKKISINDLKGKPTVIVFWQIYCLSCERELPEVSELSKKYRGKVRFYAAVIGTRDILLIEEKKREWGFDLPVVIAGYKTKSAFGIFGTPITVVIDKDLNIVNKIIGSGKTERLKKILDRLVQE